LIINSKDGRTFSLGTTLTLLFSATICATDSVAALTMIKPKKYPRLFSIVFGEGMVNDAVAIILFNSVLKIFGSSSITP
jgi:sodium/hydrogen exchanger-like protein 6/7/sodium/hydrogen exchanger 8